MSQSSVTFEEIKIIADRLSARGERPTISRVKEELGGRGSSVTVGAFLRQWRGDDTHSAQGKDLLSVEHITLAPEEAPKFSTPSHHSNPVFQEHRLEQAPLSVQNENHATSELRPLSPPLPSLAETQHTELPAAERRPEGEHTNRGGNDRPSRDRRGHFDRHHNKQRGGDRQQFRERGGDRSHRGQNGQNNHAQSNGNHQQPYHSGAAQQAPTSSSLSPQNVQDCALERDNEKTTSTPINYWAQYDYVFHGDLSEKSDRELEIIIRRMESLLAKEQSRRETAEKLFEETKEYASAIRKQVADRINDIRLTHDAVIAQLKAEARELKISAEKDLMFYRDQLGRANQKIVELIKGISPTGATEREDHSDPSE